MRILFRKIIMPIFICHFIVTPAYAQGYGIGTPVEAKKIVEQAVAYVIANGEEKALKEFNAPNGKGKFQWRDLSAFAYDLSGVVMGHPNPKLIGQNLYLTPDINGKCFRKEIIDLANMRSSGWVDYTYMDPMTRQEEEPIAKLRACHSRGSENQVFSIGSGPSLSRG